MAASAMDPHLGAADPYGPIQCARHWVHSHCCLFLCLGRQNATHQKLELGMWPWPLLAIFGLDNTTTNQKLVFAVGGILGRVHALVGRCGADAIPSFGAVMVVALNDCQSIFQMQQRTKNRRAWRRRERRGDSTGGEHGGSVIPSFWWQKSLEGCRIIK